MRVAKPQGPSPKSKPYRSKAYRQHVARKPCRAGLPAPMNAEGYLCQASHISVGNHARGMKAPDYYCIPLSPEAHSLFDSSGQREFSKHVLMRSIETLKNDAFCNWFEWEINRIFSQPKFLKLDRMEG